MFIEHHYICYTAMKHIDMKLLLFTQLISQGAVFNSAGWNR